jgi:hypothetical protein
MKPASSDATSHSVMFWVCVGLSITIVFTAWLLITKDRIAKESSAAKQEVGQVWQEVKMAEIETRPARQGVGATLKPLVDAFYSNLEEANRRKQAVESVKPYFEEQIK